MKSRKSGLRFSIVVGLADHGHCRKTLGGGAFSPQIWAGSQALERSFGDGSFDWHILLPRLISLGAKPLLDNLNDDLIQLSHHTQSSGEVWAMRLLNYAKLSFWPRLQT
jgi:hypothetical protein